MVEPMRFGRATAEPGLVIRECDPPAMLSIAARRGAGDALSQAIEAAFGTPLPACVRWHGVSGTSFIWSAYGTWLAVSEDVPERFEARLRAACEGLAAIVDQGDARVVVELGGPRVRDVLAKGLALDLHPQAFAVGHAAVAPMAHITTQLWQVSDAPTYRCAVPRSYAGSWRRWLEGAAAEYGGLVMPAGAR